MVLAAGLELAKVGESLNNGARDLWEESDALLDDDAGQPQDNRQRALSEQERLDRWYVMFMTIGGLLAFKNDGVGFIAGMLCHWSCQSGEISQTWRYFRAGVRRRATPVEEEEQLLSEH